MRQGRAFEYSIAAGWLVTALAAALVATILVPEASRSGYFWHRVCWTEFLVLVFWGSTGLYLLASGKCTDRVTRFGGIAPTISIVGGIYALFSLAVMTFHAFIPQSGAGNRVHLVVQIIFFLLAALCLVFLSMVRNGATAGLGFDKTKAKTPRELHDLLALHEAALEPADNASEGLKAIMKQLRETLLFSLNASASLSQSPEYQALSGEVQRLCNSVAERHEQSDIDSEFEASISASLKELIARVKCISANGTRR